MSVSIASYPKSQRWSLSPIFKLAIVLFPFLVSGCGLIPRLPIQTARVVQTEQYEQFFKLRRDATNSSCSAEDQEYLIDVFTRLVGEQNWKTLSPAFANPSTCSQVVAEEISIIGSMTAVVYLVPGTIDQFVLEGSGHYYLVDQEDNKIMMGGDFQVLPTDHSVTDMRRGYLDIDIQLVTTMIGGEATFMHDAGVRYRIFVDLDRQDDDVYAIDYSRRHQAFLGEDMISEIVFSAGDRPNKLIDFRGVELLQTDY